MIKLDANEKWTLQAALKTWGKESQFKMAYGECGEFVTLCGRQAQGRATDEDFISEIADNFVMMAQMREIFGPEKVDAMIEFKIDRLKQKILKHHNAQGEV